jgi:TonB-dependent starch-binding outer membrane protein SusC
MKNSLLKGLLVFLTVLFTGFANAQNVSGTVSDSGGPLPGVSVTAKGTTNSTQTDLNGKFTIKNVGSNAVLVVSYIGLKTQEVNVAGKSTINVVMKDEQSELKEVVVIGYGTVKKKDATGAIDQLNSKKFDNVAATSPADILRGKVAGVQVTSSSGEPGAGASIRIRGNSSIRSGNGPLIVVDGVPLDGGDSSAGGADVLGTSSARSPLNFINQNDIESMSILKDASSTAIYGARGANGVILITTKKSKSKEPQLSYSSSVGFSSYKGKLDVMSTAEYIAAGGTNRGGSYNWKDAILQKGFSVNNDVSYSTGTETSSTRLSIGASNTDGIVQNTGLDKYTATLNNSNDFFGGYLKLDTKIMYTGIKDRTTLLSDKAGYIGNVIASALYWNPTNPTYDNSPDGYYNPGYNTPAGAYGADDLLNPIQLKNAYTDYTNTSKLLGSVKATVKITKNLNYQFLFGIENSNSTRKSQILPSIHIKDIAQTSVGGTTFYGEADIANLNRFNKTFEHTLSFNKDINDNINLDLVGGFSYYDYNFSSNSQTAKGFDPSQTNLIDNIAGGVGYKAGNAGWGPQSRRNEVELQSYFGRATANLYKKFSLNATLRRDGSTKLGKNQKYGNFYSVGAAYKIFDNKEGLVNDLKIRGSYGLTGNQEFAPNSALRLAYYVEPGTLGNSINDNPNLKWETTKSSGVGLDFTLIHNKLSGSLDYFMKETKDLIFAQPAEATQPGPAATKFVNLPGVLQNKGFEVSLNYKVINNDNFTWDISANASFLKNKMVDFTLFVPTAELNGQGLSGAFAQVLTNNLPAYTYYLYDWRGYDAAGNSIYSDAAGNNTGLGTASKFLLDKTPLPKMNLGFSSSMTYKNFDASVSFNGAYGHYIYNNTANALFFKGAFPVKNVPLSVGTSNQATGDPNSPSTKYLEKGDYLRMGNLTFGYTFRGGVFEKAKIKSARFYVNGQNLLLFTDYSGFDPEVDTNKVFNGVPSAGIDYLAYPKAKTISFGVNLTF